ncbi:hypothetical protein CSKR_113851 [Clonorchis sinensis]|uniref:Uncharacterized protein n=1 Tax=Clonorchis sinensis TaxID=79923 RepID=A0A3R7CTQ4_CLOSI|nr:hypothetical protein CSKR_113851 [Clonorchis sinensis]
MFRNLLHAPLPGQCLATSASATLNRACKTALTRFTTQNSLPNCLVTDSPTPTYTSYGPEMAIVEHLKTSQFRCSNLPSLTAIQQNSLQCSLFGSKIGGRMPECPATKHGICHNPFFMARAVFVGAIILLECKFTDQMVRGLNPTSASRLPLSSLGQPGSIPGLVLPSGGTAAGAEKVLQLNDYYVITILILIIVQPYFGSKIGGRMPECPATKHGICHNPFFMARAVFVGAIILLECKFTDQMVRGLNPTSASRLPLSSLGQPGSIPGLVLPSGGTAAGAEKVLQLNDYYVITILILIIVQP